MTLTFDLARTDSFPSMVRDKAGRGVVGFHVATIGRYGITVSRSGTVEVRQTAREATATVIEEK